MMGLYFANYLVLGTLVPIALLLTYAATKAIYNLWFHPLSHIPGPRVMAVSDLSMMIHMMSGDWPNYLAKLHEKYGKVVRLGPNDLSFDTVESANDIYAHTTKNRKHFLKGDWYNWEESSYPNVAAAQDPAVHQELRRSFHHAFSNSALKTQAVVVLQYVNALIDQITRKGNLPEGMNMPEWYSWLTFDIVVDLSFGESFDVVRHGKGHEWIDIAFDGLFALEFKDFLRRFPILKPFTPLVIPRDAFEKRDRFVGYGLEKAKRRVELGDGRDDFFSHLLTEKSSQRYDPQFFLDRLSSQATAMVAAGSETTATLLSGATYLLLRHPAVLKKLQDEIRGSFNSVDEIDLNAAGELTYLHCVLEESLRLFPPIPFRLARDSPGAFVDGVWVPEGTTVSTHFVRLARHPQYWFKADEFIPERWLPETHPEYESVFSSDRKEASRPFSLGPRGCLGVNLAYMEMRLIMTRLIWHFDWELVNSDLDWDEELKMYVLWKLPQVKVKFTPVAGN